MSSDLLQSSDLPECRPWIESWTNAVLIWSPEEWDWKANIICVWTFHASTTNHRSISGAIHQLVQLRQFFCETLFEGKHFKPRFFVFLSAWSKSVQYRHCDMMAGIIEIKAELNYELKRMNGCSGNLYGNLRYFNRMISISLGKIIVVVQWSFFESCARFQNFISFVKNLQTSWYHNERRYTRHSNEVSTTQWTMLKHKLITLTFFVYSSLSSLTATFIDIHFQADKFSH